jgi:hypothetical protein
LDGESRILLRSWRRKGRLEKLLGIKRELRRGKNLRLHLMLLKLTNLEMNLLNMVIDEVICHI